MGHITSSRFRVLSLLFLFFVPAGLVQAAGSLSVGSVSPGTTVGVGSTITFSVSASGFVPRVFTASDDFPSSSISSDKINGQGYFSWSPNKADAGIHNITITATDNSGNSATVVQQFTIIIPSISISSFVNGPTGYVGIPMTFQVTQTGFTNPTYWIGDTHGGSTLTNSRLNASGAFTWIPSTLDVGAHTAIINVSDSGGHFADLNQDITINPAPWPAVQSLSPGSTTPPGVAVSFSVTSIGFTNPTFAVYDSYSPTTVTPSSISSSGAFSWTPNQTQIGVHNLRINVQDSTGKSQDVIQTITVQNPYLSIDGVLPTGTVSVGTPFRFNVTSWGLTGPTYFVRDGFVGSSVTADSISSSGLFVWTPSSGDIGIHSIRVSATDSIGNTAAVYKDVTVSENAPTPLPGSVSPSATSTTQTGGSSSGVGSNYSFMVNLSLGASGADVLALQQVLLKLGFFSATPNGTFGPMTQASVKKFQIANGLSPVGAVGPATRAKLNAQSGGASGSTRYYFTKPLALGATGTEVTELQKKLAALGLYVGTPTGTFDIATQTAVMKFQAAKGLEQAGSVGPKTRALLNAQ